MATQDFETLRTRVQPLGWQLFVDNSVDGDPRMHIHDPKTEKHVMAGVQANEIEDWCVDLETDERDRQTARGLIPAEGTTDGENGS